MVTLLTSLSALGNAEQHHLNSKVSARGLDDSSKLKHRGSQSRVVFEDEARTRLQREDKANYESIAQEQLAAFCTSSDAWVPCRREGCKQRHRGTYNHCVLGLGFCSKSCGEHMVNAQERLLARYIDPECKDNLLIEGFRHIDVAFGLERATLSIEVLRPSLFEEDIIWRLRFERASRLLEDTCGVALENIRRFFDEETNSKVACLKQSRSGLEENYRSAHEVFTSAFSMVCGAVAQAGFDPKDHIEVAFRNPGDVIRSKNAQKGQSWWVLVDLLSMAQLQDDYSSIDDFLQFKIVIPNNTPQAFRVIYEGICDRCAKVNIKNNSLLPKAFKGEYSTKVLLSCSLTNRGHIFTIKLVFDCVNRTQKAQGRIADWLALLRSQHAYMPVEPSHYAGEILKAGEQLENVEDPTPLPDLNGIPNGKGVLFYADSGNRYEGQFKDGKRHGEGVLHMADSDLYIGSWKDDWQHGKGTYYYSDRDIYEGDFQDGKRHGYGTLRYSDGDRFEGLFVADDRHGSGTLRYACGDVYDGLWFEDKEHGRGTYKGADGSQYEGEFKSGERCGFGVLHKKDGTVYKGRFQANQKNGEGFMCYPNGNSYDGIFKSDRKHGEGTFTFAKGDCYTGQFKDNKMNGEGIIKYANGTIYDGEFKSNKKHGRGVLYHRDSSMTLGRFQEGCANYPMVRWNRDGSVAWKVLNDSDEIDIDECTASVLSAELGFPDAPPKLPSVHVTKHCQRRHSVF